jgi:hypothetical protein
VQEVVGVDRHVGAQQGAVAAAVGELVPELAPEQDLLEVLAVDADVELVVVAEQQAFLADLNADISVEVDDVARRHHAVVAPDGVHVFDVADGLIACLAGGRM